MNYFLKKKNWGIRI